MTSAPSYYKETILPWKCDVNRPSKRDFSCARVQEVKDVCQKLLENGDEPKVYYIIAHSGRNMCRHQRYIQSCYAIGASINCRRSWKAVPI